MECGRCSCMINQTLWSSALPCVSTANASKEEVAEVWAIQNIHLDTLFKLSTILKVQCMFPKTLLFFGFMLIFLYIYSHRGDSFFWVLHSVWWSGVGKELCIFHCTSSFWCVEWCTKEISGMSDAAQGSSHVGEKQRLVTQHGSKIAALLCSSNVNMLQVICRSSSLYQLICEHTRHLHLQTFLHAPNLKCGLFMMQLQSSLTVISYKGTSLFRLAVQTKWKNVCSVQL